LIITRTKEKELSLGKGTTGEEKLRIMNYISRKISNTKQGRGVIENQLLNNKNKWY